MASTNKTTHYNLSQYVGSDKPTYLVDYNTDMSNIDTGIYNAQGKADTNESSIGTLSNLETTVKTDLVSAINEVKGTADKVGNLSNLTTTAKTDLVVAVNEVDAEADANTTAIGTIADLETTNKTNLVGAVNEVNANTPIGSIIAYAGTNAPSKYMICDGTAISRTTYANLFSIIGTTYGSGDGSTTFNLPNLKGKFISGLDTNDTDFNTLGKTGGSKKLQANMNLFGSSSHLYFDYESVTGSTYTENTRKWTNTEDQSSHSENETTAVAVQGIDDANNSMPPYIVLNYIIRVS